MTDVLASVKIDSEMVAGFEIQKREREFTSLISSSLHEVDERSLSEVRSKVAEALHEQWAEERRTEGQTVWFRPSGLKPEDISDWESKNGIKSEQTRMGTNKRGESEHQIDILNIPFTKLTLKWQNANFSGASRDAAIVNDCVEEGNLNTESLRQMAVSEHDGWVLDPSNEWKLESVKTYSTDPTRVEVALNAIKAWLASNRKDKEHVLELVHAAAESIVLPEEDGSEVQNKLIRDVAEIKMQFGRFTELSKSEQLKDIDRIMVALRALKKLQ